MFAGVGFWTLWSQFFPPAASITDKNIPRQDGKVFIVTGGSSGIGYELCKILYAAGETVYMLTRTRSSAHEAIVGIKKYVHHHAKPGQEYGQLDFIHMDLEDLDSVCLAAQEFHTKETHLHALFNNAGVAAVRDPKVTKQGLEYHYGVNSVGHVLLTQLLLPTLTTTAKTSPQNSIRVIWASSILCELSAPLGGVHLDALDTLSQLQEIQTNYSGSKVGNWFAASEFSKRYGRATGVVNIAGNPGTYVTNIWRTTPWIVYWLMRPLFRQPIHGAYTNLWMAFAEDVTMDEAVAGRYVIPDWRWHPGQREDLLLALKGKEEDGTGVAAAYFEWCWKTIAPFVGGGPGT